MLPIVTEIKAPADPEALYLTLTSGRANSFLLESALLHSRLGRYSFLGGDPFLVLKTRGHQALLYRPGGVTKTITGNPWDIIRSLLARYRLPRQEQPIPFTGGAVGCLAYDLGRYIEKIPAWAADDLPFPEGYLAFYDTIVAIDHQEEKVYLVANGFPDTGPAAEKKALARIKELAPRLEGTRSPEPPAGLDGEKPPVTSLFTREAYCRAAARAREYIAAGDIFEVNLSQRLQAPLAMEPWELYRRLRRVNPAPFAAYLPLKEGAIASASPERFLRVSQGKVETRPIKGTRRRGNSPEEDQALRQELWQSAKDRAELVMIIDLERNDLGRVCQAGSVQVPELFVLEEYATVFHLVSTVTGVLEPGRDMVDLWRATFPGGSITGAPKVRSMEIIEELEPVRRSVYTGAIGYLGFDGEADWNIVIRTFLLAGGQAYFQVGGAVTADSQPLLEYQETLDKARGLIAALHGGKV
ncbi:MAG: para-aminobenzoate synthetase component [Moorella sp. (in: firmicutes)]|nr:para-aminobenzoate synthetase component [Moorella sp. (in: firmicutes)]